MNTIKSLLLLLCTLFLFLGYDSYITGLVFIGLVQYLGSLVNPQISHYDPFLMSDYRNKLYLTYAYDIRYLNFEGEDIVPDRSHVFHVTFPNDWKTNELFHLFSAFGGVTISWINETSAFCALKDSNNIEKINKSLIKQSSNTYKVISYYDFIVKSGLSPKELIRDNIKQNSKTRASPQELNPIKKTKVYETNTGNKQKKSKLSKQSKSKKLFEESKDWARE
jgi:poly(A)-specific ribonuclease